MNAPPTMPAVASKISSGRESPARARRPGQGHHCPPGEEEAQEDGVLDQGAGEGEEVACWPKKESRRESQVTAFDREGIDREGSTGRPRRCHAPPAAQVER